MDAETKAKLSKLYHDPMVGLLIDISTWSGIKVGGAIGFIVGAGGMGLLWGWMR